MNTSIEVILVRRWLQWVLYMVIVVTGGLTVYGLVAAGVRWVEHRLGLGGPVAHDVATAIGAAAGLAWSALGVWIDKNTTRFRA